MIRGVRLTTRQLLKLRNLARLAYELNATQRARNSAYQKSIEYQRQNGYRIAHLDQEIGKLAASVKPKDLARARAEIEQLRALSEQSASEAAALQRDIEQARVFVAPMLATVDEMIRFCGLSRAELGIDFDAVATARRSDISV